MELKYGFCVDRLGYLKTERILLDLKTSSKPSPSWAIQTIAYALGLDCFESPLGRHVEGSAYAGLPEEPTVSTDSLSKLELLAEAERGLTFEQREYLENYFLGSLSLCVSPEDWKHSLATARRLLEAKKAKAGTLSFP
jgi:hypothetical protein